MDNLERATVLIAQKDKHFSEILGDALVREGYKTVNSRSGADVGKKAREKKPGLVILDINVDKKDGLAVLTELQTDSETRHIPVLIITPEARKETIAAARKAGARDYLISPHFRLSEIIKKVKSIYPL